MSRWFPGSVVVAIACLLASPAKTQPINMADTMFVVAFMPTVSGPAGNQLEIQMVSPVATQVKIYYPMSAPAISTYNLSPNVPMIATVAAASSAWTPDVNQTNVFLVKSSSPIGCQLVSRCPADFSYGATMAIPVSGFGTDYYAMAYNGAGNFDGERSGILLVNPGPDAVTVQVTPSVAAVGGHAPGLPYMINIPAGQGHYVQAASNSVSGSDLSGTRVTASSPVGVFVGNACVQIPAGAGYCDQILEALPPVSAFGTDFVLPALDARSGGSRYRILASQNGTALTYTNMGVGFPTTLNQGQWAEGPTVPGNARIQADKPILVAQYMTGATLGNDGTTGDPALQFVTPVSSWQERSSVMRKSPPPLPESALLIIIAPNAATATLKLNGTVLGAGNFASIPGTSYSVATVSTPDGAWTTESPGFTHALYLQTMGSAWATLQNGTLPLRLYGCCQNTVGNVDCDPTDGVDIGDLTTLIDNLFISFTPLCCQGEANCDGDPGNNVDIGDLTALIDNLFIGFTPLPACQ